MKKSPLKQDAKFMTTAYDKNIQGLTREQRKIFRKSQAKAAGFAASLLPIGRGVSLIGKGVNWLKSPATNFWKGSTVNFGNIGSKIDNVIKTTRANRISMQKQLKNLKKNNPPMGPTKETVNSILNYSKDFGPIIKKMKK